MVAPSLSGVIRRAKWLSLLDIESLEIRYDTVLNWRNSVGITYLLSQNGDHYEILVKLQMDQTLTQLLNSRAHFVAGRHAWTRSDTDQSAEISVREAQVFLEHVGREMGTPNVSGGTSNNPENILTLYWLVENVSKINGVYVTFNGDHTCNVSWDKPDGLLNRLHRVPVKDLPLLNIPGKFRDIKNYKPDSRTP